MQVGSDRGEIGRVGWVTYKPDRVCIDKREKILRAVLSIDKFSTFRFLIEEAVFVKIKFRSVSVRVLRIV